MSDSWQKSFGTGVRAAFYSYGGSFLRKDELLEKNDWFSHSSTEGGK